jgi:hypothetical protein
MEKRSKTLALGAALSLVAVTGCGSSEKPAVDSSGVAGFVVPALPEDAKPAFFDFGSKVRIIGTAVSPERSAAPGTPVKVRFYWERVSPLEPGWNLFTHVEDDGGKQLRNFDKEGAFRAALTSKPGGLAQLELGKIYADEQTVEIPKADEATPQVSIIVGVWSDAMRLPLVSGVTNGHDAALVAHFETGVPRKTALPAAIKNQKDVRR